MDHFKVVRLKSGQTFVTANVLLLQLIQLQILYSIIKVNRVKIHPIDFYVEFYYSGYLKQS